MYYYPRPLEPEEKLAWDIYFASICAMGLHPGQVRNENMVAISANLADQMLNERRKRIQCPGS